MLFYIYTLYLILNFSATKNRVASTNVCNYANLLKRFIFAFCVALNIIFQLPIVVSVNPCPTI